MLRKYNNVNNYDEIDKAIEWILLNVGFGFTILMSIWVLILYMWGPV